MACGSRGGTGIRLSFPSQFLDLRQSTHVTFAMFVRCPPVQAREDGPWIWTLIAFSITAASRTYSTAGGSHFVYGWWMRS